MSTQGVTGRSRSGKGRVEGSQRGVNAATATAQRVDKLMAALKDREVWDHEALARLEQLGRAYGESAVLPVRIAADGEKVEIFNQVGHGWPDYAPELARATTPLTDAARRALVEDGWRSLGTTAGGTEVWTSEALQSPFTEFGHNRVAVAGWVKTAALLRSSEEGYADQVQLELRAPPWSRKPVTVHLSGPNAEATYEHADAGTPLTASGDAVRDDDGSVMALVADSIRFPALPLDRAMTQSVGTEGTHAEGAMRRLDTAAAAADEPPQASL